MLIHIGYHKCASTFIQRQIFVEKNGFAIALGRNLIQEKLIYPNELTYNHNDTLDIVKSNQILNPKLYPVISAERLSGNPHSGGYDSLIIAKRLKSIFPDAKILIIIRKQEDIILSCYKQYIKMGGTYTLERYLNPPSKGIGRVPMFSTNYFLYHNLIKSYFDLFHSNNVIVYLFEDLISNPTKFLEELKHKLNIESPSVTLLKSERENTGMSSVFLKIQRNLNKFFSDDRLNTNPVFPNRKLQSIFFNSLKRTQNHIPKHILQHFEDLNKKKISRYVEGLYYESNLLLSNIAKVDLQKHNYQ